MGAHAGIAFFDGRSAEQAGRSIVEALRPMSPDGEPSVHAGCGVALACAAFHVWTGEPWCQRPGRSPAGLVIAWDGRLDNRHDLLLRLGPIAAGDATDAAIAVTAFERWGEEGLRSLVGEWSLAIWDARRRTLHLARDYMGVRPLYYCVNDESVMWSTELGELAGRSGRADALSDAFVAGFMTLRFASDVTPYEGVRSVPAATCLSFTSPSMPTRQRFWQLDPGLVRFRRKAQYEEQLRTLWSEAVGARLRTGGTVWAELSGGFDSSSVVCMADRLVKDGRVPARGLQPISHVALQSPEGDERRFIAHVEARIGVCSEILGGEEHLHVTDEEWDWVSPFAASGVALACARRVRERGGRVVLSGVAGDAVMGCQPDNSAAVLDDLATGHVLTAVANMRRWSRASRKPFLEIGWRLALNAVASNGVSAVGGSPVGKNAPGIELLTARLKPLANVDASELARAVSRVRPAKREMAAMVLAYALESRLNVCNPPAGVVYTYPFTHRPLVEYVLAIPGAELSAPGEMRWLMRRAFDGLVPLRILGRISKGYYPPCATRAARPLAEAMRPVERLEVVRRGWIDPARLDAAIHTLIVGGGNSGEVRRVLRLEQWLASRQQRALRRAPAVIPQRKEVRTDEVFNA